jgi:hypothetical protein
MATQTISTNGLDRGLTTLLAVRVNTTATTTVPEAQITRLSPLQPGTWKPPAVHAWLTADPTLNRRSPPSGSDPLLAMDAAGGEQLSLAAVRDALVRLEDSVVFALIERARHPRNAPAYAPAAGGGGGYSLVEFFVREAEALNAKASFFLFMPRLFVFIRRPRRKGPTLMARPSVFSVVKTCIALPG